MEVIVKTFAGMEDLLLEEVKSLGGKRAKKIVRGVVFEGDMESIYKGLMGYRTALRMLVPVFKFKAHTEKDLYFKVKKLQWEDYLNLDQTFSIDCVAFSDVFKHSKFAALRVKDALCDRYRQRNDDKRPSVDRDNADVPLHVHITGLDVTISLDMSGFSLHQRGYRTSGHEAPLNEALAAGMILLSGWDGRTDFVDPFCGTGTLLIEAALIAQNKAPRLELENFACMRWESFERSAWQNAKKELKARIEPSGIEIIGGDVDPNSVRMARAAARQMGCDQIEVKNTRVQNFENSLKSGFMITNPPYGERLKPEQIIKLYKEFGDKLKKDFQGFTAWVLSSNFDALKHIGLRPSRKIPLKNGALDCKMQKYELYEGTKKVHKMQ